MAPSSPFHVNQRKGDWVLVLKGKKLTVFGYFLAGAIVALSGCADDKKAELKQKLADHMVFACKSTEEFKNPVTGYSYFVFKYNENNQYITAGHLVDSQDQDAAGVGYIYDVQKVQKNSTEISFGLKNSREDYFDFRLDRQSMVLTVMTPNFGMSYLKYNCDQLSEAEFQNFLKEKRTELDELFEQRKI
ncbi:hypothetical protein [Marinobacter sp. DUT-1]|uniref:hypothetical protein n=1 Tax=Marinobacter sp. DUT-1 TaxID=3412037 RepID=UPI003D17D659